MSTVPYSQCLKSLADTGFDVTGGAWTLSTGEGGGAKEKFIGGDIVLQNKMQEKRPENMFWPIHCVKPWQNALKASTDALRSLVIT